jgi:hypothetical protein
MACSELLRLDTSRPEARREHGTFFEVCPSAPTLPLAPLRLSLRGRPKYEVLYCIVLYSTVPCGFLSRGQFCDWRQARR